MLILVDIIVISQIVITSNYPRSEISFIGGVIVVTGGILDCNSNRNSFKKEQDCKKKLIISLWSRETLLYAR